MTQNIKKKIRKRIINTFFLVIIIIFILPFSCNASIDKLSATNLTPSAELIHEFPSIALNGTMVHVVWNTNNNENRSINYRRSLDNGKSWDNTILLSTNSTTAYNPSISAYKNNVHVVWIDNRHGNTEIYHKYSSDNGITWSISQRLTNSTTTIRNDTIYDGIIQVTENDIYIVWRDYRHNTAEIYFMKSSDNGISWTDNQRLTKDYSPSYIPFLAVQDNNLYIVYQDGGLNPDISILISNTNGDEWSEKKSIIVTEVASEKPVLAISNNILYLVWQDDRAFKHEVYFRKSIDGGKRWNSKTQLSFNSTYANSPNIYVHNKRLIVIWQDIVNNSSVIHYRISEDGGESWKKSEDLVNDSDSNQAKIIGDSDNIHIVMKRTITPGWSEIWHYSNHSLNIYVTSISVNKKQIDIPGLIKIIVDGLDLKYNKSDLNCIIQYMSNNDSWKNLSAEYVNNQWEAELPLDKSFQTGNYSIRALIENPEKIKSKWETIYGIQVKLGGSSSETPGFEWIFIVIAILSLIIIKNTKIKINKY